MLRLFNYSSFLILIVIFVLPLKAISKQNEIIQNQNTILTNCNIISCTGSKLMKNMTITIAGNKITEIKSGKYKPKRGDKKSKVIDLKGGYVLPGFWNVHMHLTALLPDPNRIQDNESTASATIRAGLNAMDGIRHGFTSIRSVGERDYIDIAWRDAFSQGYFMGTRIFASGNAVTVTGGHRGDVEFGSDGVS